MYVCLFVVQFRSLGPPTYRHLTVEKHAFVNVFVVVCAGGHVGMALAEHESELERVEVFSAFECTDHAVEGSTVGAQCQGLFDGARHSCLIGGIVLDRATILFIPSLTSWM